MEDINELLRQVSLKVSDEISPKDVMYQTDPKYYLHWGLEALRCIRLFMLIAGKGYFKAILDMGCGHGRVLRVLKAAFPGARLTACDIDHDAVDFCARVLEATPVYSHHVPNQIPLVGNYDLIWTGSLLTHLNRDRWATWVQYLTSHLAPGGLLIFSSHGRRIAESIRRGQSPFRMEPHLVGKILEDYDRNGFGYHHYAHSSDYGISIASFPWIYALLTTLPDLAFLHFVEGGWNRHHDMVCCVRGN